MKNSSALILKTKAKKSVVSTAGKQALTDVFNREPGKGLKLWRRYQKKNILLVGAGGLGGFIALGLVRKAVGKLVICDGDFVETSNLNRQRFTISDIGKNKAKALAKNLKREVVANIELSAVDMFFEEALEEGLIAKPYLCICMPDNDEIRGFVSLYCLNNKIPLITGALSHDSDYGYLFIQPSISNNACWGCYGSRNTGKVPCGPKANINLPMVAAGFVLTACDSLIGKIPLPWNYRRFSISGALPEVVANVPVFEQCDLCGNKRRK
jgi:hypothetical protein